MGYVEEISGLYDEVYKKLISWDISDKIINLDLIGRKRTPPTVARSEFLINRAMGDWAEEKILDAFTNQFPEFFPTKYGNSDKTIAGDPNFKLLFSRYVQELEHVGKRPDILIFEKHMEEIISNDISNYEFDSLKEIVPRAKYGIEVRSSKIKAKKYNQFRQNNHSIQSTRNELSITPKVEDLPLVVKWIDTFHVPHFYFQVCLDEVYGISFRKVLEFVLSSSGKGIIERNRNNAEKATIHIPFSNAIKIGVFENSVEFDAEIYEDERGRINPYVKAKGGKLILYKDAVRSCFLDQHRTLDY